MNCIIKAVENLLDKKHIITIAIDGMSAAGKTTLADVLSKYFDCNVFHMDDFFLAEDLRTPQRLKQVGGNVDYSRFKCEVIDKIKMNEPFTYRAYDCMTGRFSNRTVTPGRLNIVEGAYSLHPTLSEFYDYKILIKTDFEKQRERIEERNGQQRLNRFIEEWIPRENDYLERLEIEKECDIVIKT